MYVYHGFCYTVMLNNCFLLFDKINSMLYRKRAMQLLPFDGVGDVRHIRLH